MPLSLTKTEKIVIQDSLCQMNECFKVKTSVDETLHMVLSLLSYALFLHALTIRSVMAWPGCLHQHLTYTGLLRS